MTNYETNPGDMPDHVLLETITQLIIECQLMAGKIHDGMERMFQPCFNIEELSFISNSHDSFEAASLPTAQDIEKVAPCIDCVPEPTPTVANVTISTVAEDPCLCTTESAATDAEADAVEATNLIIDKVWAQYESFEKTNANADTVWRHGDWDDGDDSFGIISGLFAEDEIFEATVPFIGALFVESDISETLDPLIGTFDAEFDTAQATFPIDSGSLESDEDFFFMMGNEVSQFGLLADLETLTFGTEKTLEFMKSAEIDTFEQMDSPTPSPEPLSDSEY